MAAEDMIIDLSDEQLDSKSFNVSGQEQTAKFEESFWGPECRGFDVLLANLKTRSASSHYISEYVKERISIEKTYVKGLQKLSKSLSQVNDSTLGSLHPLWLIVLKALDDICSNREKYMSSLTEIHTDINKYSNKLDSKFKENTKGEIDTAHKSLQAYRDSIEVVKKTRKVYKSSCKDLADLKSDYDRTAGDPNKVKDLERLEGKLRKGHTHMEHARSENEKAIESYHKQWAEFEEKMVLACKKFQSLEEEHVQYLRDMIIKTTVVNEKGQLELYRSYSKLKENLETLPVKKLLMMFTQLKGTGHSKPELMKFIPIQVDVIQLSHSGSLSSIQSDQTNTAHTKKTKRTAKQKKEKVKKKTETVTEISPPPKDENVDEEGFTIRPKDADKIAKFSDEDSQHDSSDSESDFEADADRKIQGITIKDKATVTNAVSVDELSKVVKTIKLEAPSTPVMHRTGSTQSLDISSSPSIQRQTSPIGSQSLFNQPIQHETATPPSIPPPTIAPPTTQSNQWEASFGTNNTTLSTTTSNWASFSTPPTSNGTPPLKHETPPTVTLPPPLIDNDSTSLDSSVRRTESNLTSSPILFSLPPPLSAGRRREGVLVGGATGYKSEPVSPMMSLHTTMLHNKSDIVASGNHPIRVSSGTSLDTMALSPLATIRHTPKGNPSNGGSGSVIPLAIAFQEICNAIYKGSDLSKTVVKVTGTMDFSFPLNTISLLSAHTPLKFKLTETANIAKLLHNQNLITKESENVYVFLMDKLAQELKNKADKSALPYHNVSAIKYELTYTKSNNMPLQLTSFWKCDPTSTTFVLNYTYTPTVFPPSAAKPNLANFAVSLTVGGGVTKVESEPTGVWLPEKSLMTWKLPNIVPSEDSNTERIKAKFSVSSGPTVPTPAMIQFMCDGITLSGIDMSLECSGYKLSLRKDKCISGKYVAC